jgi:L-lysine exporter family protein LysE/ArgO
MALPVFLAGMTMGLSLIVAIGAQNAFVLRQGLKREHVLAVCLACALSDAALIVLGVTSFARIAALLPWLDPAMRFGGAAFLAWYGARSLCAAFGSSGALAAAAPSDASGLGRTLLACLAITWLNPHVYLDTVVLLGTVSTGFPGGAAAFAAGAIAGSFLFFFALGYGAGWLRPLFARPGAWRILEGTIAAVMWGLALKLAVGG